MQRAIIIKWEKVPGKEICVHMSTEVSISVCVCALGQCVCAACVADGDGHSSVCAIVRDGLCRVGAVCMGRVCGREK